MTMSQRVMAQMG